MAFTHFSRNGEILPIEQAVVPLSNIEYSYGFGVYETVRVSRGQPLFVGKHCQRLMESARIIGLEHSFDAAQVKKNVQALLDTLKAETCNLKILLIGSSRDDASISIIASNPLFPDRKLYKNGVSVTTYQYEREFPHAKSLNMLPSYLAYREAKRAGAYDALLFDRDDCVTEGTRTNFFAIKDRTIYGPPESDILLGVTRDNLLEVADRHGFTTAEQRMPLTSLSDYDGLFLTSTSSKIMPIAAVGDQCWEIPETLRELMQAFNAFLDAV